MSAYGNGNGGDGPLSRTRDGGDISKKRASRGRTCRHFPKLTNAASLRKTNTIQRFATTPIRNVNQEPSFPER
jgi:hypothetical protein